MKKVRTSDDRNCRNIEFGSDFGYDNSNGDGHINTSSYAVDFGCEYASGNSFAFDRKLMDDITS
jgi:hypothetical protein